MRKPPLPALRNSAGAFDLPSIITGVVVVGILAAGVLAAIFGVIPFAQDRGAKQDLSSIRTAEGVAKAKDNRFMDHASLLDVGYLQLSSTETTKVKADAKGTCYVGIAKSGTGTLFYSTDANTDPQVLDSGTVTGCLTEEELAELIDDVGGIEVDTPKGAPENLKLTAVSPLQAKATWDPVKGATGYKVEYRIEDGEWVLKTEKTTATSATISALPEQAVGIQVYGLTGDKVSEPSAASVKLPDSTLKNPSFEQGSTGWVNATSLNITAPARTGSLSAGTNTTISQVVTIPNDTPVLTYWYYTSSGAPEVQVDKTVLPTADTGLVDGAWSQRAADLSSYTGKTVTLYLYSRGIVDDVALQAPITPSAPQSVTALSRSGTATVAWVAPVVSGGSPITAYTVSAWAGGKVVDSVRVSGDQRSATLKGLTAGESYTFTATAANSVGSSAKSASYGPVKVTAGAIANPGFEQGTAGWTISTSQNVIATIAHSGSKSASTYYTPFSQVITVPTDNPVLTYWHYSGVPSVTVNSTSVPTANTGAAENGWTQRAADLSSYTGQTVKLTLSGGYTDDVALQPPTVPSAPGSLNVLSRSGAATATWTAPLVAGGTPVTAYTVTAWSEDKAVGNVQASGDQRSATLKGLTAGESYTFTATAANSVGSSVNPASYGPVKVTAGAIANPGFEQGTLGWTISTSQNVIATIAHSGSKSASTYYTPFSQVITVPTDNPVLTYWHYSGVPSVTVNSTSVPTANTGAAENGWTQRAADLSSYTGQTVKLTLYGGYTDDVALQPR